MSGHNDQAVYATAGVSIGTALFQLLTKGADFATVIAPYIACLSGLASIALVIKRWRQPRRDFLDNDTESGV